MAWRTEFTGSARKQLKKLDKDEARLVLSFCGNESYHLRIPGNSESR